MIALIVIRTTLKLIRDFPYAARTFEVRYREGSEIHEVHQLTERGAMLIETARTATGYASSPWPILRRLSPVWCSTVPVPAASRWRCGRWRRMPSGL